MLIMVGIIGVIAVACLAERVINVRRRAHRRVEMASRLAAAVTRAEVAEEKRQQADAASAALTSVVPAIKRPPRAAAENLMRQSHRPAQRCQRNTGPQRRAATGPGPGRQPCEQPGRRANHSAE